MQEGKNCQKNKYSSNVQTPETLKYGNKGFVPRYFPPLACSHFFFCTVDTDVTPLVRWLTRLLAKLAKSARSACTTAYIQRRQHPFVPEMLFWVTVSRLTPSCMCGFYSCRVFSILWFERTVSPISVHPKGTLSAPLCRNSNNATRRAWVRRHPDETAAEGWGRGGEKKHIQWHRFATFPQQLISLFIIHLWTFFLLMSTVHVSQEWPGESSCQYPTEHWGTVSRELLLILYIFIKGIAKRQKKKKKEDSVLCLSACSPMSSLSLSSSTTKHTFDTQHK